MPFTTTFAPLPRLRDILRALVSPIADAETATYWQRPGERAIWFSRSAHSLGAVTALQSQYLGRPVSIWVPDYFCNQPLRVVRAQGHSLVFYPVTEGLEPDWTRCRSLLATAPIDVFVLVHYFGVAAPSGEARRFADQSGAVLLEDAVHVLRPTPGVGESGEFVMYSPHKWIAAPHGAALVDRRTHPAYTAAITATPQPARHSTASDFAWAGRRLLQRTPAEQVLRWLRPGGPPGFLTDPPQSRYIDSASMTRIAHSLVSRAPVERIAAVHRQNFRLMSAEVRGRPGLMPFHIQPVTDAPYKLVLRAGSPAFAARLYSALRRARLPVESWPDLPPEVAGSPDEHPVALGLRRSILMLPIHYTARVEAMILILRRVLDTLR